MRVRAKSQPDTLVTQEKYNTLHDYGAFLCSHPLYLFLALALSPDGMQKRENGDIAISGRHLGTRKRDVF